MFVEGGDLTPKRETRSRVRVLAFLLGVPAPKPETTPNYPKKP